MNVFSKRIDRFPPYMFGKLKQAFVIWLTVPMTFCGVVLGLLATDLSFTFLTL